MRTAVILAACVLAAGTSVAGQEPTERNVIYGMYSGLALLMDVYRPTVSNQRGVVVVPGSGWSAPLSLTATPLKNNRLVDEYTGPLLRAGYTVFVVNHRATPRFTYPTPLEDVQRAVRFIRANSMAYGISPERIGAVGSSSGGHLVSMLGTLDGAGDPQDADPVNRLSSKVQAVVAFATPFDLTLQFRTSELGGTPEALLLGARIGANTSSSTAEYRRYVDASPITYASGDDAPMLLVHGTADTQVVPSHSEAMERALSGAGVAVRYISVPNGRHDKYLGFAAGDDVVVSLHRAMIDWLNRHLDVSP